MNTYTDMLAELERAGWPQPMSPSALEAHLRSAAPMVARVHASTPTAVKTSHVGDGPPRLKQMREPLTFAFIPHLAGAIKSFTAAQTAPLEARITALERKLDDVR